MNFIFLGGDRRMLHTAEALSKNHNCRICGCGGKDDDITGDIYDCAVLPVQKSPDGEAVPTENGSYIRYSVLEGCLKHGGIVFTGNVCPALESLCYGKNFTLINYLEREELAAANAVPTAEGALELAIKNMPVTVFASKALVTGYGRIAKILSRYLLALGAEVTVACRKKSDLKWAEINGCKTVFINDKAALKTVLSHTDVIFNTVPAEVFAPWDFNAERNILYIELASSNGYSGEIQGPEIITARGLPGKTAPVTAGQIIAETIENILTERSDFNGA